MNSMLEALPYLSVYQPALLALAILSFAILVQSLLTAPLSFSKGEQEPGKPLKGSHKDLSFRVIRTHLNSVESYAPFAGAVFIAIIAGVNPNWVNWLVCLHVGFRILFWFVYYWGVGKVAGGPRTLAFVGGLLTNAILVVLGIFMLITS